MRVKNEINYWNIMERGCQTNTNMVSKCRHKGAADISHGRMSPKYLPRMHFFKFLPMNDQKADQTLMLVSVTLHHKH